jgi:hypothetical protein
MCCTCCTSGHLLNTRPTQSSAEGKNEWSHTSTPLPRPCLCGVLGEHPRSLDARVLHQSQVVAEDTTDKLQLRISHARKTHDLTSSPLVLYARGLFCFSGASDPVV